MPKSARSGAPSDCPSSRDCPRCSHRQTADPVARCSPTRRVADLPIEAHCRSEVHGPQVPPLQMGLSAEHGVQLAPQWRELLQA